MRQPAPLAVLMLCLCGCKPAGEGHTKAIIGAVLIDGEGGPPVTDSAVIISGGRVAAAGPRSNPSIPAEADRINGAGKFLVPALVDICNRADPAATLRAAAAEEARARVAELAAQKPAMIHIGELPPAASQAALEAAREAGFPVAGHISTQAGARLLVDHGASLLIGMIADTEDLDSALVFRLRDLRIVVAPALNRAGERLAIAGRNTRRLFQAGVPIGLASMGGDPIRETELLAGAGIPPLDVIVAATRNSALALHELDRRGTVEPGRQADLLLLAANPAEDVANLRRVALRMSAGEWVK